LEISDVSSELVHLHGSFFGRLGLPVDVLLELLCLELQLLPVHFHLLQLVF